MSAVLISLLAVLAVLSIWGVSQYNALVSLSNGVDAAWSNIDAQITRRADLIPNLVETVKGYAEHEKGTLDAVVSARALAMGAKDPAAVAAADGALTGALRQLFALAESYPQLRANENFLQLQGELARLEDAIAGYRQIYNTAVKDLNTKREVFPTNLVVAMFSKFKAREYFEATEDERKKPIVSF
jgi:LemA protein